MGLSAHNEREASRSANPGSVHNTEELRSQQDEDINHEDSEKHVVLGDWNADKES